MGSIFSDSSISILYMQRKFYFQVQVVFFFDFFYFEKLISKAYTEKSHTPPATYYESVIRRFIKNTYKLFIKIYRAFIRNEYIDIKFKVSSVFVEIKNVFA